jgi:hypothetical protein
MSRQPFSFKKQKNRLRSHSLGKNYESLRGGKKQPLAAIQAAAVVAHLLDSSLELMATAKPSYTALLSHFLCFSICSAVPSSPLQMPPGMPRIFIKIVFSQANKLAFQLYLY